MQSTHLAICQNANGFPAAGKDLPQYSKGKFLHPPGALGEGNPNLKNTPNPARNISCCKVIALFNALYIKHQRHSKPEATTTRKHDASTKKKALICRQKINNDVSLRVNMQPDN
ncbi:hypothetical protein OCV73_13970 [Barnesiella propionica]|uniref:hypothetical protein n=1 Tax=Barnesiella propionica TaxID=2981781 RepID=UPI0011C93FBE|nr:hypothetical protein [Barnesiella propionica]MCU6770043.1 hypothetical protein [Barnesiella propionica]